MRNYWIVAGSEENWRIALASNGIWGWKDDPYDKIYWLAVSPGDVIFFYVTGKVGGIVGYGIVRNRFIQDSPLWPAEITEGKVKWPLRFEFDVDYLLPDNMWHESRVPPTSISKAEFRKAAMIRTWEQIAPVVQLLNPSADLNELRKAGPPLRQVAGPETTPSHEAIKSLLVEIGKIQRFIATPEYPMGSERLDVVWRRLPESVPTFAFEVQISGDLYHALGKLKHARDIWNSRVFLVASSSDRGAVNQLLSGTFHELQPALRFIETEKIQQLHQSKSNLYEAERQLGLIPGE